VSAKRLSGKRAIASDVWSMMAGFAFACFQRGEHLEILRELGLTPGHLKALVVLDPGEPRPMRAMAEALACDASMVTWLVDRLEERGLVERQARPADRRVKTVALTDRGIEIRDRLLRAVREPPAELQTLDTASLLALREQLSKLPASASMNSFWGSAGAVPARP
jgi:DNA-binding MarR family transcriptional regulator